LLAFYYIYISQGSVETHLQCAGIYNNNVNVHCLQLKEFWKSVHNWQK